MLPPLPDVLLPLLVADLADDEARDVLDAAAFTGGRVWVPLETAPVSASRHILEVHTPGIAEPAYYIAEPLGPPTEDGFPLRIQPIPDAPLAERQGGAGAQTELVRGRRSQSSMNLSESHTKDLSLSLSAGANHPAGASCCSSSSTEGIEDSKIGRALAGGKLVIEQLIGRGGVGAVYKARHRELMMPVAVKVLHESFQNDIDFCRRFYAEALAASRLDHPNITRVIDFGQEPDGQLYFAMEYLDGVELRAILEKERKLPSARAAQLMMQVCAGLSHAHARGVVHRDIKPENLVLVAAHDDDGKPTEVVKVCDFGIALQQRALPSDADQTGEGVVAGTPEYMSPEQCRSDELDARSDVYACGVILYEAATGQLPFTGKQAAQLLNKHQFTPPLPPSKLDPDVDPLLEQIILKALAKDVKDRHQSMRQLRAELRELLDPIMVDASPPPPSLREVPTGEEFRPINAMRKPLPTLPEDSLELEVVEEEPSPSATESTTNANAQDDASAWLERGSVYSSSSGGGDGGGGGGASPTPAAAFASSGGVVSPGSAANASSARQSSKTTSDVEGGGGAGGGSAWTQQLAQTIDPAAFAKAAHKLEPVMRSLATNGDMRALWDISSVLHRIAVEGNGAVGSRAWSAANVLRVFDDPALVLQIAEQLLNGSSEAREPARRMLVHAGVAGAYGLYGARVKLARAPNVRKVFVPMLSELGPKAWPVVRASLEKIAAIQAPNPATLDLAEDLLLCVPFVGDENAGHVVLKYLRSPHSKVCRAATAAIVQLWRDRAKPVLVAMVTAKEDVVRVAGIAGLRQLGAIDEHVVPRLHAILMRRVPASEEVRAAAAVALAQATETARQPAVSLLSQLLNLPRPTTPHPGPTSHRDGNNKSVALNGSEAAVKQDAVIVAVARSLLAIGGKTYCGVIAERAERSAEPLRGQLRGLLTVEAPSGGTRSSR